MWASGETLTPVGEFGVKLHHGAVRVSDIGAGALVRIPVGWDGASGTARVVARDLGPLDDFAFAGRTVLAAVNQENKVVRIDRQGRTTEVLNSADGLDDTTSVGRCAAGPSTSPAARTSPVRTPTC